MSRSEYQGATRGDLLLLRFVSLRLGAVFKRQVHHIRLDKFPVELQVLVEEDMFTPELLAQEVHFVDRSVVHLAEISEPTDCPILVMGSAVLLLAVGPRVCRQRHTSKAAELDLSLRVF